MNIPSSIKIFLLVICCLAPIILIGQNENYVPNQFVSPNDAVTLLPPIDTMGEAHSRMEK